MSVLALLKCLDSSLLAFLKSIDSSILAFLKSIDGFVIALLKCRDGSVFAHLMFPSFFSHQNSTDGNSLDHCYFEEEEKTHLLKHVYLKDMACYAGLLLAPAEGKNISYSGVSAHFRPFQCQVNFPGLNTAFLNREYFFTIDLLYFSVLV